MAVFNKAVMVKEDASIKETAPSIFDLMVEAVQIDHSLFESLIEVDFAEAYNESGVIALTEEEQAAAANAQKNGILNKIWEVIQNIAKSIDNIFKSLIEFISNLISNDGGLWDKYKSKMGNKSALTGCPVKGKYISSEYYTGTLTKYTDVFKKFEANEEDPNAANKSSVDDVKYDRESLVLDSGDKSIISAMSDADFTFMTKLIQDKYSGAMNDAKTHRKKALENVKALEREFNDNKKAASKAGNSADAGVQKNAYDKLRKKATALRVLSFNLSNMINTACAVNRGAFLKIGSWALKNDKNDSKNTENKTMSQEDYADYVSNKYEESATLEAFNFLIDLTNEAYINRLNEV